MPRKTQWLRPGDVPEMAGPGGRRSDPPGLVPGRSVEVAPVLLQRILKDGNPDMAAALKVWLDRRPGEPRMTWSGIDASSEAVPYLLEAFLCAEQIRLEVLDHLYDIQRQGAVDTEVSSTLNELLILESSLTFALSSAMKIHAHLWGLQTGSSSYVGLKRKLDAEQVKANRAELRGKARRDSKKIKPEVV